MRIVVVSDSHGDVYSLRRLLRSEPKADLVIHLGDGAADLEGLKQDFPEKMFLQVKGNGDLSSELPVDGEYIIKGRRIFYTHGHKYRVKMGMDDLLAAAEQREADILLYGHTHVVENSYADGMYVMNPGSLRSYEHSYGAIDISRQGVLLNILRLK